jgi:hypothetical protein
MGHRRNRKRERKAAQVVDRRLNFIPEPVDPMDLVLGVEDADLPRLMGAFGGTRNQKACGVCREFVEDPEGGRGLCLHPGSGIVSPWTDTDPCDFFSRRR